MNIPTENGGSIEAVLRLNVTPFETDIQNAKKLVTSFKRSMTSVGKDSEVASRGITVMKNTLVQLMPYLERFRALTKEVSVFKDFANGLNRMAQAVQTLSNVTKTSQVGMIRIKEIIQAWSNAVKGLEVNVKGQIATEQQEISTLNQLRNSYNSAYASKEKLIVPTQQYNSALEMEIPSIRSLITGNVELANAEERRKRAIAGLIQLEQEESAATDKATASMNRQNSASRSLANGFSMLRSGITLVGSMIAYNFIHKLGQATTETINAKSEMNGYFQMLGYGKSQVDDFNKALDETVKKFPRLNKYSLGETISSIGVEFELTTAEMKKAIPVVSMITSEYLRAGRNVNEASLAVKDILQGEFQRLSRETGVKGDQLKEAGWSGDKNDVMGLLEALDKVGKSRNWDKFVAKANSLNDAVLIMQNRFGEWSADMVEKVQPLIVNAFNEIMQVASTFARHLNGVIDFISGNKFAQGIGWVAVASSVLAVFGAFVKLRTGANMLQIAQMGLRNSIIASIFQLEAETVASYGSVNAIISRITGIEAETVAEEGRLVSILASASGMEIAQVKEVGRLKTLGAIVLGLNTATLSEEGFTVALLESVTGMEVAEIQALSLAGTITALGVSFVLPVAIVGAFAVALGGLAINMYNSAETMKEFNKLVNQGDDIMKDAYGTQRKYLDRQKKQQDQLSKLTKGSDEYLRKQQQLRNTNRLLAQAQYDVAESSKAITLARNSQEFFDTTREEKALELQGNLADAYIKAGLDSTVAYDMANESYRNAKEGADQLYTTLQGLNELDTKQLLENEYMLDLTEGMDTERIKHYISEVNKYQDMIHEGYEKGMTDESFFGRLDGWLTFYEGQIGNWFTNLSASVEKQDWGALWDNLWRGIGHGFADLPIFSDIWGTIFDHFNIKETYGGRGWEGLAQWCEDTVNVILEFFHSSFVNALTKNDMSQYIFGIFDNMISTVEDGLNSLGEINIFDKIWDIIFPQPVSAENGESHPEVQDEIDQVVFQPIRDTLNGFIHDPLGTLGLDVGGFNVVDFINQTIVPNVEGVFTWVQDNIINPLVDGIKNGIENTPVLGDVAKLILGDGAEEDTESKGQSVGTQFSSGVQTGIAPLDDVINKVFSLDDATAKFNTNSQNITSTATSTASSVATAYQTMKNNQKSSLDSMVSKNTTAFSDMHTKSHTSMLNMRDSTSNVTSQMITAWTHMKDSIIASANKIKSDSESRFTTLATTIGGFYKKIQNPSLWGSGSSSLTSHSPTQASRRVGRAVFGHGYGPSDNKYRGSTRRSIGSLKKMLCPSGDCGNIFEGYSNSDIVDVMEFLGMIEGEHGFGGWNFGQEHYNYIKTQSDKWDMKSPIIDLAGGISTNTPFKVREFNNGTPHISFDQFQSIAGSIFSVIPYRHYMDSSWKGSWLGALLSGACNCSDGADALIALARTFGFSAYKQWGKWGDEGHFWAVINGTPMDTTAWQKGYGWRSPKVHGYGPSGSSSSNSSSKTVNVTVDMSNSTVYGIEDLDARIEDGVKRGLREEFNDPYSVVI